MLAALSTAHIVPPVRAAGHGTFRLRGNSVQDLLQSFNRTNGQRATINAAGDFTNPQGITLSEFFGSGATGAAAYSAQTIFGNGASASGTGACAFGYLASAGGESTAYGRGAIASNVDSVAVGYGAGGSNIGTICLGAGAASTANNQCIIGGNQSSNGGITDMYIGKGVTNAAPSNVTINATGGSGTNIAGANLILGAGKATGNAAGGYLSFQTSAVGSSGTTLQTLTERMRINSTGGIEIPAVASPTFSSNVGRLWLSTNGVALGYNANTVDSYDIAIGAASYAGDASSICIGYTAQSSGGSAGAILIGANTYANGATGAISIGTNAVAQNQSPAAHECIFGDGKSANYYLSDWYPFSKSNDQSRTCTIHGPDSVTGTNKASYDTVMAGGRGTGTGAGGKLKFQCPVTQASGTTQHTLASVIEIQPDSKLGFYAATPVTQQVLATGASHTVDDVITFLQTIGLCKQS